MTKISQRKLEYRARMESYLSDYKSMLIVGVDNVRSSQMQDVRIALRGKAVLLMGKNTVMRKVIREAVPNTPQLEKLLPVLVNNVGIVFTNDDLVEVRDIIREHKAPAAARSGAIAPSDCIVPPGPTGLDPGQTAFFQALNIRTKIVKGSIEIEAPVHLIREGEKVSPSAVSLLSKLNIRPFFYAMKVQHVFEAGSVYDASVLDITEADLLSKFTNHLGILTALSLQIGVPNAATLPHSFTRAFRNLLALAVTTDIEFKEAIAYKEYLADPEAYAAKHGLATAADAPKEADKPADKPKEPTPEPSSEESMGGGGLFGDDESD